MGNRAPGPSYALFFLSFHTKRDCAGSCDDCNRVVRQIDLKKMVGGVARRAFARMTQPFDPCELSSAEKEAPIAVAGADRWTVT
jgi:hypothetical protein